MLFDLLPFPGWHFPLLTVDMNHRKAIWPEVHSVADKSYAVLAKQAKAQEHMSPRSWLR